MEYSYTPSFFEMLSLLSEGDFLGQVVISLVFVILGILIVRGTISRNNSQVLRDSGFSAITLRPIQPTVSVPTQQQ